MAVNPATPLLVGVLESLGDEPAVTYSPFLAIDSELADIVKDVETTDDPDVLATLLHDLWETKAAVSLVADDIEAKLARLVGRKLDTERWHLETKTASAKVSWDHDLARGRIEAHSRETGEAPLDLLYRVASVAYYRQGVLTAEGINADGLKSSEPGRTRVVITEREAAE